MQSTLITNNGINVIVTKLKHLEHLDISENLSILKNGFKDDFLQLYEKLKLPFKIPASLNAEDIISALKFDKKFTDSKNRFVLLKGMNKPAIVENIDEKLIADCIIKNLKKEQ